MLKLPVICCLFTVLSDGATIVQALASPRARSRKNQKRSTSSGGGFAKPKVKVADQTQAAQIKMDEIDVEAEATSKRAVSNLFWACSHLQNPDLYQPKWADACKRNDDGEKNAMVATRDVTRGQVLTLFPIHALGLRTLRHDTNTGSKKKEKDPEFVVYDQDVDRELFRQEDQHAGLRTKLDIPLDAEQPAYSVIGNRKHHALFSMLFPSKEVIPGWLGGQIMEASTMEKSNCIAMPLPGVAPFCAVVATKDVKEGEEVIQGLQDLEPNVMEELKSILAKEYASDLSLLGMHIEMACDSAQSVSETNDSSSEQLGPFHQLNQHYPGLKKINHDPDVYAIENFLTDDECNRIIAKATPHLKPCLVKNERNGKEEQDTVRTSTNTNIPQCEVPTIMQKITNMACCNANQLEILQVLNYKKGQEFIPHTDGFSGKFDACGFQQSSRMATIFCYLNDVVHGGTTYFPEIDLDIQPRKGTAVIHFPADLDLREDARTLHQGSPAIDDKWLLTTWVWQTERTDEMYAESKLPSLSGDII